MKLAIYTCPKCGLAGTNVADRPIHCAGVKAWGTAHRRCEMEVVETIVKEES